MSSLVINVSHCVTYKDLNDLVDILFAAQTMWGNSSWKKPYSKSLSDLNFVVTNIYISEKYEKYCAKMFVRI